MLIDVGNLIINTSQIQSIEPLMDDPKGRGRCHVTFADGTKQVVHAPLSRFERLTGDLIPAPAGYVAVVAYEDDSPDGAWLDLRPVIAFRSDGQMLGLPLEVITDEGPLSDSCYYTIQRPDGRCFNGEGAHDNAAAFKAEFVADVKRRRAARLSAKASDRASAS